MIHFLRDNSADIYHAVMQTLLAVGFITILISFFMNDILKRFINAFDSARNLATDSQNRVSALEQRVSNLETALSELASSFQNKPVSDTSEVEQMLSDRGF